jgi:hypothetical protein
VETSVQGGWRVTIACFAFGPRRGGQIVDATHLVIQPMAIVARLGLVDRDGPLEIQFLTQLNPCGGIIFAARHFVRQLRKHRQCFLQQPGAWLLCALGRFGGTCRLMRRAGGSHQDRDRDPGHQRSLCSNHRCLLILSWQEITKLDSSETHALYQTTNTTPSGCGPEKGDWTEVFSFCQTR